MTEPTEDLEPPAAFEQPGWKPKHRDTGEIHIVSRSAWRPANPHDDDGDNAYLYQGDHRRSSLTTWQMRLRDSLVGLVVLLILGAAIAGVTIWAYSTWTP
jgi:hypothetical protein